MAAAAVVAAGAAYYLVTQDFPIKSSNSPEQGKVEIYTSPEKATVLLDGKERKAKSPTKFSANVGKHTVTLKLTGYDEVSVPIDVKKETPAVIQQTFTKNGQITTSQKPSEFKTYTNKKYKYSIKYPDNWEVEAKSPEVVNFFDRNRAQGPGGQGSTFGISQALARGEEETTLAILTQPNPGNLSPTEWYKARPEYAQEDQSQIKTKELTVNGRPAFQYETPYGFLPYLNTIITGNGSAFILQQVQNSPYRATYDQVIQTFTVF